MSIRLAANASSRCIASVALTPVHNGITSKSTPKRGGAQLFLSFRGKSTIAADAAAKMPAERATTNKSAEATLSTAKIAGKAFSSSSSESVPIGNTLVAMTLAIATVSAGAAIAENATASSVPTFHPKQQRFDQSTFMGRLSKMLLACDPFLLTYSDREVRRCKAMVDDYENALANLPRGVSEKEMSRRLWEAQVCAEHSNKYSFAMKFCL